MTEKHQILQKYLEGIIKGYSNSLVIVSPAGLGKSESTTNALKQAGLRKDEHYIYFSSFATPKALVGLLEATSKLTSPKILVIDEAEEILSQREAIGILKSALWEVDGQRKVYWITSREHIEFEFTGKIIFILNKIDKNSEIVNALLDRSLVYDFNLKNEEIYQLLEKRAELPYQNISYQKRKEIVNFIKENSNGKNISLRILPKIYNLFLLSPNHYKVLALRILK